MRKNYIIAAEDESGKEEISEKYDQDMQTDGQTADTLAD